MFSSILQIVLYLAVVTALAIPLGSFIKKVMFAEKHFLTKSLLPVEKGIYKVLKIDTEEKMSWKKYLVSVLIFSAIGIIFVFLLQILQGVLPGNPEKLGGVAWPLALNTAISFATNTNWQAYSGESCLSYLTQFLGLTVQNFVSSAAGIAVLFAVIRGFIKVHDGTLGNFWVDMVRSVLYILLPLNIIVSVLLIGGGVVQNFKSSQTVKLLEPVAITQEGELISDAIIDEKTNTVTVDGEIVEDAVIITEQYVPMGPAASQIAIKQTGTNGGGFFGVNSAHPLENPNPFTNFIEFICILLIPMALCFSFGHAVKNKKQGWAIFAAMGICLVISLACVYVSEINGGINVPEVSQIEGNMEGKESRFGIASSVTWAVSTTATSNGSVNSMHDSYTPLGGMVTLLLFQLGEVIFGGVGTGLCGMLCFVILTVFIAGLMVGRTPEFLGKKIEPYEMKWATVACLTIPFAILISSAVATVLPEVKESLNNRGAHGLSEILYAYSSASANQGSAFAGFNANTLFINISLALAMLFGRFVPIISVLAIAGSLGNKKKLAVTEGTLSTTNAMFVFLLIFVVLLIGALSFFPALSLGPIAEFLQ